MRQRARTKKSHTHAFLSQPQEEAEQSGESAMKAGGGERTEIEPKAWVYSCLIPQIRLEREGATGVW